MGASGLRTDEYKINLTLYGWSIKIASLRQFSSQCGCRAYSKTKTKRGDKRKISKMHYFCPLLSILFYHYKRMKQNLNFFLLVFCFCFVWFIFKSLLKQKSGHLAFEILVILGSAWHKLHVSNFTIRDQRTLSLTNSHTSRPGVTSPRILPEDTKI